MKTKARKLYRYIVRRELLLAIIVAVFVICGGVFLAHENNQIIPLNTNTLARYPTPSRLSFLSNWDGPNYIQIAQQGYSNVSLTNFFPLYPLLIRLVNTVVSSPLYSALLVSWVCFVGAIYYYLKLVKLLFKLTDNIEALRATAFFVIFPTAIFLFATYTESLFAFLALGAIYYALKRRYFIAAVMTMFSTATHINGAFVVILVALMLLEAKEKLWKVGASVIIGSLGLLSYMLYLKIKYNSALEFLYSQQNHGWLQQNIREPIQGISWLNVIFIVLLATSAYYWWRRKHKSFSVYSLLFIFIPLVGGQFGGFNRYVLMAFPVPLMFYDAFRKHKAAYQLCVIVSAILWTYFLFQYAGGYVGG